MPRAESNKPISGSQPYRSPYDASPTPSSSSSADIPAAAKKKHVCSTCDRSFTTSGHLARHSRIHTGERNHKCPFPGCETRCSRQDNLQQHYRIHLSPGSRRSSTRSSGRTSTSRRTSRAVSHVSSIPIESAAPAPLPPPSPPPLEPSRTYAYEATPPDSPPPLAQATLPATVQLNDTTPSRASSSASPDAAYASLNHTMLAMQSSTMPVSTGYSYRMNPGYSEDTQSANFGYGSLPSSAVSNGSFSSYSPHHEYHTPQVVHQLSSSSLHQVHTRDSSPASNHPSRHSISHISHPHPQSFSHSSMSSPSPVSSHSVSSHTSGPPTPTYPAYHTDPGHSASAYHQGPMLGDAMSNQGHFVQAHYMHTDGRFESPPPTLAPIQETRYPIRRDSLIDRHAISHQSAPYIHHPQPLSSEFTYQPLNLGHAPWKTEGGMRKGLSALV